MRGRAPRRRRPSRAQGRRSAGRAPKSSARRATLAQAAARAGAHPRAGREPASDAQQELEAREADVRTWPRSRSTPRRSRYAAATSELQRAEARLAPSDARRAGRVVDGDRAGRRRRAQAPARERDRRAAPASRCSRSAIPHRLEIVADLLSTDAVRVKPGARAIDRAVGRRASSSRRGCAGSSRPASRRSRRSASRSSASTSCSTSSIRRPLGGARRRLSRRSAHRHLGSGRRAEGADERAVPRGREVGGATPSRTDARGARSSSSDTRPVRKPRVLAACPRARASSSIRATRWPTAPGSGRDRRARCRARINRRPFVRIRSADAAWVVAG